MSVAAGDGFALGELDRVMNGNAVASRPGRHPGGEWDALRALPKRTRRRLIGAAHLRPFGLQPDAAAELICERVPGVHSVDEAIAWYVAMCLRAIAEARADAARRRRGALARRAGQPSYYAYRSALARERGYSSLWHMRRERGWAV